jgi:phosphatidylinositol alpha-1,6-mannosyltransferase
MGILVITWNFPPRRGGMENLLAGLCYNLKKTHPVFVITSLAPPGTSGEDWISRSRWSGLVAFFIHAIWRGSLILRSDPKIKVIVGGSALAAPLVAFLAMILRRKSVVLVHGSDVVYPKAVYQLLCVRWLKKCDRVIANSRYTATLAKQKGVSTDSISVIPPGLETAAFVRSEAAGTKKRLGLEGKKVLLCVGRLARRKGVKEFVETCLPKIILKVPDACLVIVGENPTESLIHHDDVKAQIEARVRDLGLASYVRFLGRLDDQELTEIYQAADLLVLPVLPMKDDVEGFGIVLLEAAAAGKPVVATRVGGIPDAVEDGHSGLLMNPGDYESVSVTVVRLLGNERARREMGECGRARAQEKFRWEEVVKSYWEVFRLLTP